MDEPNFKPIGAQLCYNSSVFWFKNSQVFNLGQFIIFLTYYKQTDMLPTNPTFVTNQSPSRKWLIRPSLNANAESPVRGSFYPPAQTMAPVFMQINHAISNKKSSSQSFSNSDSPSSNPVRSPVCTEDFLIIPKRILDHEKGDNELSTQSASPKKKPFVPKAEHKKSTNSQVRLATENVQIDQKFFEPIKIKILNELDGEQNKQLKVNNNKGQNSLFDRNKTQNFQSIATKLKTKYRMSQMPMKNRNFEPAIPEQTQQKAQQKINTVLSTNDINSSFGRTKDYLVPSQKRELKILRSQSKRKHYVSVTPNKYKVTSPCYLKSAEKPQKTSFIPSKKTINRFQILKLIGSSKLSEAYVCYDKKSNSIYCLKKIKKSLINESPSLLNQFIRKIGLQFRSVHPNIIQIYDVFCDQDYVYLIEEYMQSGSLRDFLNDEKSGKIQIDEIKSQENIIQKVYNINSGLNYIHNLESQRKIKAGAMIHGDLRPQTVLINFGCCKISPINPIKIEKATSLLHTYVCPEALVDQSLTTKSDMWNLGLILFELCARKRLFKVQQSRHEMSLADQIVNMDYNKQILNIQLVTHTLKDLIRKLLLIRPDERISSSELMKNSTFNKRVLPKQEENKSNQSQSPEMQRFRRQIKAQNNNFPKYHYNPSRLNTYFPGRLSTK